MWKGLALLLATTAMGCTAQGDERRIVASVYPLAFAAEQVAPPGWRVVDLTPPGTEAHDLELSLEDRATIEEADVVLYLGDIGFQPQVEAAVADASGVVAAVTDTSAFAGEDPGDPHVWLSPRGYLPFVNTSAQAIAEAEGEEPVAGPRFHQATRAVIVLADRYTQGLAACRYGTLIVSHEAFGYLAADHGLDQHGLTGATPEAEPSAERLQHARQLIEDGRAGAVFYDESEEARRIVETFAADAGVPALPLSTLESRPAEGDYFTVMERNLESLREGLQCR